MRVTLTKQSNKREDKHARDTKKTVQQNREQTVGETLRRQSNTKNREETAVRDTLTKKNQTELRTKSARGDTKETSKINNARDTNKIIKQIRKRASANT